MLRRNITTKVLKVQLFRGKEKWPSLTEYNPVHHCELAVYIALGNVRGTIVCGQEPDNLDDKINICS